MGGGAHRLCAAALLIRYSHTTKVIVEDSLS